MDREIPRLDWRDGYDDLLIKRWDEEGYILFDLVHSDGRVLAKATQPFHRYSSEGYPVAAPGCFWIKNYSEHRGLGDALIAAGVIERTGRQVAYGPFDASSDEYVFTPAYRDEPSIHPGMRDFIEYLLDVHRKSEAEEEKR